MKITLKCNNCTNEDQSQYFYDEKRQMIWCNMCGESDQLPIRNYDWEEE